MNIITRYSIKRVTAILFIFYISFLNNSVVNDSYAITFNNGIPNVYIDVNRPNEDYFGGSRGVSTGGTSLTFLVQNLDHNTVQDIVGGGLLAGAQNLTINGSTFLNINNTHGIDVVGGSYDGVGAGRPMYVTGSINITINNSVFDNVYGGHYGGSGVIDGSINIDIENSVINNTIFAAGNYDGYQRIDSLKNGNLVLNIKNSKVDTIIPAEPAVYFSIVGSFYANILRTQVNNLFLAKGNFLALGNNYIYIGDKSKINNLIIDEDVLVETYITVNDSYIQNMNLIPTTIGLKTELTLQKSTIDTLTVGTRGVGINAFKIFIANIDEGGHIDTLNLGNPVVRNAVNFADINIRGGSIGTLNLSNPLTAIEQASIFISSGTIDALNVERGINRSLLSFIPGGTSTVKKITTTVEPIKEVQIAQGAKTCWGDEKQQFTAGMTFFTWEGELQISKNASVTIEIQDGLFTTNGGTLSPINLQPNTRSPLLSLKETNSILTIKNPLNVNMDFSPECLNSSNIPLVRVPDGFANPNLFTSKNRKGLIWSNVDFDYETNIWYLTKVEISKDYYAYSAAREASNWLRQKNISTAQNFSYNALINKHEGFWFNTQGGYENIDVAVGSSKMPWAMANLGYNYRHDFSTDFTTNYGLAFGYAQGWHKWNLENRVKNTISIGMIDGYAGVSHSSGVYGLLTAQIAMSKIKTKNPGFNTNTKWSETVPTGAVELGWNYTFASGITVTPRVQVIGERLSQHSFKLSYDAGRDTVVLKKNTTLTSVAGLMGSYKYTLWSMPFDVQASVDWIKGITGDYASHSKFFNKTFKDKNDSDVARLSLGASTYVLENLSVGCQIFGDIGNDNGFGGQANVTYKF